MRRGLKGRYYFVNAMLLKVIEMYFQDFMPSNQEQNERQNVCLLPSSMLSSTKSFYGCDDDSSDHLEAVFDHICVLW